jgi:hypothetical protein
LQGSNLSQICLAGCAPGPKIHCRAQKNLSVKARGVVAWACLLTFYYPAEGQSVRPVQTRAVLSDAEHGLHHPLELDLDEL